LAWLPSPSAVLFHPTPPCGSHTELSIPLNDKTVTCICCSLHWNCPSPPILFNILFVTLSLCSPGLPGRVRCLYPADTPRSPSGPHQSEDHMVWLASPAWLSPSQRKHSSKTELGPVCYLSKGPTNTQLCGGWCTDWTLCSHSSQRPCELLGRCVGWSTLPVNYTLGFPDFRTSQRL
jgi:hypothetical protein